MIFETATRHGRRNFYNSFGGFWRIIMSKTLYLFCNINRLITPERRRWYKFEGDCVSKNNNLRISPQAELICATNQSMVQEFCDKIGEQIVFFARLALRKHTQRMCPKRHIAARAQNTAYFDVKRPLYHIVSALRKRLFTLARQKIFCDLRRNMII